ncbi:outer membrane protein assembly factor BamB [Suttonella ornithocola]|uniref:Outer membrane protein assembly factor BamB n=1 Tax=Suttonella ornithocola TaxID=279832 RepID=A0A380MV06_9GAMM|nr:outer membrane protein assembly factor BamB [Suttonella ornithocola]SUO95876.1 Lipoprotein yfgL precursor [Suttonella ornithocola]
MINSAFKKNIVLTSLSAALFLTGCSSWFYGKSNQIEPSERPIVTDSRVQTAILWKKNLGKGGENQVLYFSPANIRDTIYSVSANGNFYSINAQTGIENYRLNLGNAISTGVTAGGDFLFLGTQNGDLMALNQDGQVIWRKYLGGLLIGKPSFADGLLVAYTSDGEVSAFNPADGTRLWRYHSNTPPLSLRGNASPVIGGGVVILLTDDGFFTVLEVSSGLPMANQRIANISSKLGFGRIIDQDATPKVNNGILFGSAYQNQVYAIDLQNGVPKWQNESVATGQDFAISPTDIYLTTADDSIVALNQENGQILWENKQLRGRQLSPPVAIPGRIGVVDYKGWLYWLDSRDGKLIGEQHIGKVRANTTPLVLDSEIIWQLVDGQLIAIRPQ